MTTDEDLTAGESWLLILVLMLFSVACAGALIGA